MQSSSGPRPPAARRAAWFIGLGSVSPPGPQRRVAGRIAAALRCILQSVGRDEAEARAAIIQSRDMAGVEELAERAQAVTNPGLPESVRPMVEAWTRKLRSLYPETALHRPRRWNRMPGWIGRRRYAGKGSG